MYFVIVCIVFLALRGFGGRVLYKHRFIIIIIIFMSIKGQKVN